MSLVTANNVAVLSGTIAMPLVGVWTADLVLDQVDGTGFDAGTRVTISSTSSDDLTTFTLSGVVAPRRTGSFLDAVHVRIIGGAGGLARMASARSYVQPGAFVRDVVNGLTQDSGEMLSGTADAGFLGGNLTAWAVMTMPVSQALETLIGIVSPAINWRILADGTLWIGTESWTAITPTIDSIEQSPMYGTFDLGVETPSIVPGTSISGVGNINRVEHQISAGKIRSRVWVDLQGARGIADAVGTIVAQATAEFDYFALYRFKVASQSSDLLTVGVNPIAPNDRRLAGLGSVPVRAGSGVKVQFAQGAEVLVGWDGGDPRSPYACLGLSSDSVQRIQMGGNTDAARRGDHADVGTLVLTLAGTTVLSGTYTDPDGAATPVTSGATITLKAKISEGSSIVGLG